MSDDETPWVRVRALVGVEADRVGDERDCLLTPRMQKLVDAGYYRIVGHPLANPRRTRRLPQPEIVVAEEAPEAEPEVVPKRRRGRPRKTVAPVVKGGETGDGAYPSESGHRPAAGRPDWPGRGTQAGDGHDEADVQPS